MKIGRLEIKYMRKIPKKDSLADIRLRIETLEDMLARLFPIIEKVEALINGNKKTDAEIQEPQS